MSPWIPTRLHCKGDCILSQFKFEVRTPEIISLGLFLGEFIIHTHPYFTQRRHDRLLSPLTYQWDTLRGWHALSHQKLKHGESQ